VTTFRFARLSVAFAAVMAVGCAALDVRDERVNPEPNPLWFARSSGAMHVMVHRRLTAESKTTGEAYEIGRPEIDPAHHRVFVGTADGGLYALRAGDGSTIWRFATLGVVQSEPLYDESTNEVFFGSHDGALYAVDANTGALHWRFMTGAEVIKRPALVGDTLYVANGADQLFALDRKTGQKRWTVRRTSALGIEIAGHAGPKVDRGTVYFAYSDGHVAAYDARDGREIWAPVDLAAEAEQKAGNLPRELDVDTTPIVADFGKRGRGVFVASYAGGVFALDADSGARLWHNELATGVTDLVLFQEPAHAPSAVGPYAGGARVPERRILVASSAKTGLFGIDPATGSVHWRTRIPEGGMTAAVSVAGALGVGTTRYGLFLISPLNGKVIDGIDVGSGFAATPAAYGNRLFAISNLGTFVGVHVDPPVVRR
jgi:outer membrane protein assembly factor BamB